MWYKRTWYAGRQSTPPAWTKYTPDPCSRHQSAGWKGEKSQECGIWVPKIDTSLPARTPPGTTLTTGPDLGHPFRWGLSWGWSSLPSSTWTDGKTSQSQETSHLFFVLGVWAGCDSCCFVCSGVHLPSSQNGTTETVPPSIQLHTSWGWPRAPSASESSGLRPNKWYID